MLEGRGRPCATLGCVFWLQHGSGSGMAWRLISFSLRWSLSAPLWMALYGLFVGLCSMTLVLVGMLLQRQLVRCSEAAAPRWRGGWGRGCGARKAAGCIAVLRGSGASSSVDGLGCGHLDGERTWYLSGATETRVLDERGVGVHQVHHARAFFFSLSFFCCPT